MIRLHVPLPFHTLPDATAYSHCAFTSRALLFCKMMGARDGYEIISYANGDIPPAGASTHVPILTGEEFQRFYPPLRAGEFHDKHAQIGTEAYNLFCQRLSSAVADNLLDGDIVLHPFGRPHTHLVKRFRSAIHIEPFVGYDDHPFGAYRVFESQAWRHYHLGRWELMRNPATGQPMFQDEPGLARNLSWVIPNCRDPEDWPLGGGEGDYVLFMGRLSKVKGLDTIARIIVRWDRLHPDDGVKFVFAGQGDISGLVSAVQEHDKSLIDRIDFRGPVLGADRANLLGDARCTLCPTNYVEPGGGVAIESLMCGTPVIASDWGCFTESVEHGRNGARCKTLADWIRSIELAKEFTARSTVRQEAIERFSTETAAPMYDACFRQLRDALANGPDSPTSFNIP